MRVSPSLRIVFAVSIVSLFGSGCWRSSGKAASDPAEYTASTSSPTSAPKPSKSPPTDAEVRADLRTALQNFKSAKSVRANISLKSSDGNFTAKMDFAKPNRLRGSIQLRSDTRVDMIVVENDLYMRFNNDPWANISKIPSANAIATTMKESLTGQSSLDNLGVDEDLPVKRTADRTRKCDLYRTTLTDKDGKAYEVEICVADGFPKILELKSATNPLKIDYYDYNSVFLIERPAK